jgi:hypothetical protein
MPMVLSDSNSTCRCERWISLLTTSSWSTMCWRMADPGTCTQISLLHTLWYVVCSESYESHRYDGISDNQPVRDQDNDFVT